MTKTVDHRERFEPPGYEPFLYMHDLFQCAACRGYAYVGPAQYGRDANDRRPHWQYCLADDDLRADVHIHGAVVYIAVPEDPKRLPCPREDCPGVQDDGNTMLPVLDRDHLVLVRGNLSRPLKHLKIPAPESMGQESWPMRWVAAGGLQVLVHTN